jgi:DNA-binding winged helix-turn-helix (wHTH) protein
MVTVRDTPQGPSDHAAALAARVRFGRFEFDRASLELKEAGSAVHLRQQPARVLGMLLASPGSIVTREELRTELWGNDTLIDFDQGLNYCVKEIRAALGDNAGSPFYVETLPRRGYRWIGPAEPVVPPEPGSASEEMPRPAGLRRWIVLAGAAALLALGLGLVVGAVLLRRRPDPPPTWQRVTFRRGSVSAARFAPGGEIAYTAAWDGEPFKLYAVQPGAPEARLVTPDSTILASISARGEALSILATPTNELVRSPLAGGAAKVLSNGVLSADASPDGSHIVVVRGPGDGTGLRVESPIGTVLGRFISPGAIRISPDGSQIALIDHPIVGDDAGVVRLWGPGDLRRTIPTRWASLEGLAWSPGGKEILITAAREGADTSLWAISPETGAERLLLSAGGRLVIRDVAPDGRILLERVTQRPQVFFGREGGSSCELTWLDATSAEDIAADGRQVLLAESGNGGGKEYSVYLRSTDCAPPVRIGSGRAFSLTPDGKAALAAPLLGDDHVDLLPIGAGATQRLAVPGIVSYLWAKRRPDGALLFSGSAAERPPRTWLAAPGHAPEPLTPELMLVRRDLLSPDGRTLVAPCPGRRFCLYPVGTAGEPIQAAGFEQAIPLTWDTTGAGLLIGERTATGMDLFRLDPRTGQRAFVRRITPADPTGGTGISRVYVTPDGNAWTYSVTRRVSELYVVHDLRL